MESWRPNGLTDEQVQLWSDLFKDVNGVRPRLDCLFPTVDAWDEQLAQLIRDLRDEDQWYEDEFTPYVPEVYIQPSLADVWPQG